MSHSRVDERWEKARRKLSIKPSCREPSVEDISYHIALYQREKQLRKEQKKLCSLTVNQLIACEGKLYKRAMRMLYSAKPDRLPRRFYHGLKKTPHETRNLCFYKKIVDRSGVMIRPFVNEGRAVAERARRQKRTDIPMIEESSPR